MKINFNKKNLYYIFPKLSFLIVLIFIFLSFYNFQADFLYIERLDPSFAPQGKTLNINVIGINFYDISSISLGEGITINSFEIKDLNLIECSITISKDAKIGFRDINIIKNDGIYKKTNAFEVRENIFNKIIYNEPSNDIKYAYFYYIPESVLKRNPIRILLYGHGSSVYDKYSDLIYEIKKYELTRIIPFCEKYGYALLLVVIPRNFEINKLNTQSMNRYVMFDNYYNEPEFSFYKRPDLVIIKAIDKFVNYLEMNGYNAYPRVFMTGFSNGGFQSQRFPLLHPDKVIATAIGGAGGFVYPIEKYKGIKLTYPVGVYDIKKIKFSEYSLEKYKLIPHFIFVGENDLKYENDPVGKGDNYDNCQSYIINKYFGKTPPERAKIFANYLESLGMKVLLKIYTGYGHNYTRSMLNDTFDFFESIILNEE